MHPALPSFIAVEPIDSYCVLISSRVVYFLKPGDYVDREAIFLEVKYDDLYHCLVSKDHGKVYVQLTKKAESTSSGVAIPGPSHQKPMVSLWGQGEGSTYWFFNSDWFSDSDLSLDFRLRSGLQSDSDLDHQKADSGGNL